MMSPMFCNELNIQPIKEDYCLALVCPQSDLNNSELAVSLGLIYRPIKGIFFLRLREKLCENRRYLP